ncbi:MAG TPA: hypothetical protein VJU82_17440 [Acidobacteriaceae bacterium]|nr:hypothetical protein [Acidobacteriaceae bacterium]
MSARSHRSVAASGRTVCLLGAVLWIASLVCPLTAQSDDPGTSDWITHFIGVVNARGKDCHIPEKTSRLVGFPHEAFPDKEIDIWGQDTRAIAVVVVNGETSLLVTHESPRDIWMFRVSETGVIEKALWVSPNHVHHMTDEQAADQLTAEETYWNRWEARSR